MSVSDGRRQQRYRWSVKKVLLVRHGQSEWNAQGRWQGQADPPLTELGKMQAAEAVHPLKSFSFDWIASSGLDRAHTTATIIAEGLGIAPPHVELQLNERSAGEWSGMTKPEIAEQWPGYLESGKRPPSYEHDGPLLERVTQGLASVVAAAPSDELCVVAHGGVIYVLEEHLGAPFAHIGNLGARWIQLDGETLSLGDRVHLLSSGTSTTPGQI